MNQKIVVRNIQPDKGKTVWKAAKTLGILGRCYFYLLYLFCKADMLIAVDGEKIVGCVCPRITTFTGEKIGTVDVIFVGRNVRGKGIGKALVEAVLSHFQEAECKNTFALVDRYNSSSWNMFLHKGFTPFESNEQFRVYGWKILWLWLVSSYFIAPGVFYLKKESN
ncbi:GNAT family N-acetyltransferase [Candidatus Bipolaricaulota bacterium]|nr:GNAT family N-acetyltransferase [Candidatus Bipolaricaulota bacterium]